MWKGRGGGGNARLRSAGSIPVRRQDPCIVVNNPSLSHRLPLRAERTLHYNLRQRSRRRTLALSFPFCPRSTHTNCYVAHVSDSACCGLRTRPAKQTKAEAKAALQKGDATPRCETESAARRSVRIYGQTGGPDRERERERD